MSHERKLLTQQGSDLVVHGEGFCDITAHDMGLFRSWPDTELNKVMSMLGESCERVQGGRLRRTRFDEIQQACGLNYNPLGFIASSRLRSNCSLLNCVTFDWVHTMLQDGVFVLEASLIVDACSAYVEVFRRVAPACTLRD